MKTSNLASLSNKRHNKQQNNQKFQDLLDEILVTYTHIEDRFQIAALIESMGWTDDLVYSTFGIEDVFSLADEIWETIKHKKKFNISPYSSHETHYSWKVILELVKSFFRGVIIALPMAISVFSMIILKFSLWSYEYFSLELATCIAIGTILSFITVGGFTQAIARRGFFYIYQGYFIMGRQITFFFIRWGYVACIVMCCIVYLFNFVFNIYPQNMFLYIALYFFFLNSIWLSVTVMYILRRELTFTGLIIVGIGIVYLLKNLLNLNIIESQLIGITIISIIGLALAFFYFKHEESKSEKGIAPKLPRVAYTVYSVFPYFLYGFLYFLFLYIDRVVSWSTNQEFMPYFIWFRGNYELGLDYSLLALILPLGVSEVLLNKFMIDLGVSQKQFWAFEANKLNHQYLLKYYKYVFVIFITAVISAVCTIITLLFLNQKYFEATGKYLISDPITFRTLYVSIASYVILAIGLMNAVFLFSLSQPHFINRVLIIAIFLNIGTGFLLSRWIDYSWAIFGLLIGSCYFALYSSKQVIHVISKLDYYLYVAS